MTSTWCTFMVSCARRARERAATLQSLAASDWRQEPTIVIDDETGTSTLARIQRTWSRALTLAAQCDAELVLLLEDDIRFTPRLRSIVENWAPLKMRGAGLFFASLFNNLPSIYPSSGADFALCPPGLFWGFQAIVTTPATVSAILSRIPPVCSPHIDECVATALKNLTPILVHRPGLVTHLGVSTRATFIGVPT